MYSVVEDIPESVVPILEASISISYIVSGHNIALTKLLKK